MNYINFAIIIIIVHINYFYGDPRHWNIKREYTSEFFSVKKKNIGGEIALHNPPPLSLF